MKYCGGLHCTYPHLSYIYLQKKKKLTNNWSWSFQTHGHSLHTLYSHILYTCTCWCVPLSHFRQGLRKSESSTDKMQHLLKVRDQSIQNQQQEIAVCAAIHNNEGFDCAILLPILLHYQQPLSVLERAFIPLPSVCKYSCWVLVCLP